MTKEDLQAIADLLKPIIDNQKEMQATQDEMQATQDKMQATQDKMQATQDKMQAEILKINTTINHEIDRSIKVTMEGHTDLNRKLDKTLGLENRVETLEDKMTAVEFAIQKSK